MEQERRAVCVVCGKGFPAHRMGPLPKKCSPCARATSKWRFLRHGANGYRCGCRCSECREGASTKQREYWRKKHKVSEWMGTERSCVECGSGFFPRQKTQKYCSPDCKYRRERRECPSNLGTVPRRQYLAHKRLERALRGTVGRTWQSGPCASCGDYFVGAWTKDAVGYCSNKCKRREANARRRARSRGAKITPGRRIKIYERDNWVCQICGDPVNRESRVPELDAPVIDHTIPLNRGGDHAPDNWQTAHFYCNSYKRDLTEVA